jgi:hypothetical protein
MIVILCVFVISFSPIAHHLKSFLPLTVGHVEHLHYKEAVHKKTCRSFHLIRGLVLFKSYVYARAVRWATDPPIKCNCVIDNIKGEREYTCWGG